MTAHIKQLGFVGLGKMGYNMVLRLLEHEYQVVAYNKTPEPTQEIEKEGAIGALSLQDLVAKLPQPRIIWLMVPYDAVQTLLNELTPLLHPGDIVIDGGNSFYKDSIQRAKELGNKQIAFIDAGVSGGPERARTGSSIMVGGNKDAFDVLEHLFADLCVDSAYAYMGSSGAGHFVKMVHNGIEYGMMQAIAEGFDILKNSEFDLSLRAAMKAYKEGSVIASDLLMWLDRAFEKYGEDLSGISGSVHKSGEGDWTDKVATELNVQDKVLKAALQVRDFSSSSPSYQGKLLSAMRGEFGGHDVREH